MDEYPKRIHTSHVIHGIRLVVESAGCRCSELVRKRLVTDFEMILADISQSKSHVQSVSISIDHPVPDSLRPEHKSFPMRITSTDGSSVGWEYTIPGYGRAGCGP